MGAHTGRMGTEHVIDTQGVVRVQCWCCGTTDPSERMIQLGDHPEVHLCVGCAHVVHLRAWEIEDGGRGGPSAFARDVVRHVRSEVVRRGWHRNRVLGGALRRLGRRLP